MSRISEQDELLLNRLLDGDLAADEAAALQERIAREPILRETLDALMRINSLLAGRGAVRANIDWRQFRQDVLGQIGQEASPAKTLRFPQWAWIGAPLAAAAAIALFVVTSYQPSQPAKLGVPIAAKPETGVLAVRFNRPSPASNSDVIQVSYKQSPQLAEDIRTRDQDWNSRPTAHMYLAEKSQRPVILKASLDLPPL